VNHGSGLQSLLHIAMIRLLRRKIGGGAIVAVDEPESGLHPHMQRNIVQMLARMADEGQVFVTTHSTDVADLWQQRNLRDRLSIVWRSKVEDRGSWVNSVAEDSPEMSERLSNEDRRTVARYLAVAGSEIFFADGVIIVEGPTEAGLIPAVAQTLGHNLNHRNITVIKAGGKDRMPALLKLCRALGLPHYAVMDFDAVIPKNGKPTYKQLPGLSDKSLTTIGKVASSLKAGHPAGIVPVPSKAELKQINMALSEANCVVWSQDSEHVFTHGIQSPYLPCYEVQDELYGTSAVADWLPHSTPTEQDVLDTLKQSKDEVYWRTMVERWSQSGQTWLNPEIEQVVKAIFGSLSEQRQQLAKAEIPTRASS